MRGGRRGQGTMVAPSHCKGMGKKRRLVHLQSRLYMSINISLETILVFRRSIRRALTLGGLLARLEDDPSPPLPPSLSLPSSDDESEGVCGAAEGVIRGEEAGEGSGDGAAETGSSWLSNCCCWCRVGLVLALLLLLLLLLLLWKIWLLEEGNLGEGWAEDGVSLEGSLLEKGGLSLSLRMAWPKRVVNRWCQT